MDFMIGALGLAISFLGLFYLFGRLILIPLLPLSSDNIFNLTQNEPVEILFSLALCGLCFIGTLSVITIHKLKQ